MSRVDVFSGEFELWGSQGCGLKLAGKTVPMACPDDFFRLLPHVVPEFQCHVQILLRLIRIPADEYTNGAINAKLEHSYAQALRKEGRLVDEVIDNIERRY